MHGTFHLGIAVTLAASVLAWAPDGRAERPASGSTPFADPASAASGDVLPRGVGGVDRAAPTPSGGPHAARASASIFERPPNPTVVVGGLGLSATLAALGGILLVGADARHEAVVASTRAAGPNGCYRMRQPMCQEAVSAHEEMETLRNVGIAGLIAGSAVLGGTLVYTFFPRSKAKVTVSAGGVAVTGAF